MKSYSELTPGEIFSMGIEKAKQYVNNNEVTWDEYYEFTKNHARMLDGLDQPVEKRESRGRPVEYPNSKYHQYTRFIQRTYRDRKNLIRKAFQDGIPVSDEIKDEIISKIGLLTATGVKSIVMGRLIKELKYDREVWFVPYAVRVLINEGRLTMKGRVIKRVPSSK